MRRHEYDYGLHLSEEDQLELAIRLSLQEAQRRGDVIATNEDNIDEAVGLDDNDQQQQHQSVREEETVEFEYPQSPPAQD
jgi:Ubiquitin interaction motif.